MKDYIGVKKVKAEDKGDVYQIMAQEAGGNVKFDEATRENFEKDYFQFEDSYPYLEDEELSRFISKVEVAKLGNKTVVVTIVCITGFEITEYAACISPVDFDAQIGKDLAYKKCLETLRAYLAFTVSWAKFGLG